MPRQSRDVIYKAARRASCATRNSPGRYLERVVFVEVRQRLRYAVLAVQAEEPMAATGDEGACADISQPTHPFSYLPATP